MDELAERFQSVRERAERAAARVAHPGVLVVAVSKTKSAEAIRSAHEAGCRDFGENYVQELQAKAAELSDLPGLRWHFIGHLQRNKVKQLLGARPVLVHGVDSERLLEELEKRAPLNTPPIEVLIEVNLAGEASKSGTSADRVPDLLEAASALEHVRVRGLMTMPPPVEPKEARPYFRQLRELAERIGRDRLPELSMGMSHDFEVAIEEGATIVRVGTAIFGAR